MITVDNGPEFAGKAMDEWAYRRGIKLSLIRPGKPVENAFAESFNGRLCDECLNINWFMSVRHAREIIESWRQDYNEVRPPQIPHLDKRKTSLAPATKRAKMFLDQEKRSPPRCSYYEARLTGIPV